MVSALRALSVISFIVCVLAALSTLPFPAVAASFIASAVVSAVVFGWMASVLAAVQDTRDANSDILEQLKIIAPALGAEPLDAEGDYRERPCPHCGKRIWTEAKVCRHCTEPVELARPPQGGSASTAAADAAWEAMARRAGIRKTDE